MAAALDDLDLPSSDEEDDDFDPTAEKLEPGDADDLHVSGADGKRKRKRRGAGAADEAAEAAAAADAAKSAQAEAQAAAADMLTPAQAAKKARIGALWEQLHVASTGSTATLSRSNISLASLCSNTDPKKKRNTDLLWMRNLGLTPGSSGKTKARASDAGLATPAGASKAAAAAAGGSEPPGSAPPALAGAAGGAATGQGSADEQQQQQQDGQQQQQSDEQGSLRAAAAAALAAAREGAAGGVVPGYNKVAITETRRFAGKDLQVTLQVDRDSKEAKRAAAAKSAGAASGLDAFLAQIQAKKKVSVLDKSKMDWQDFKTTDKEVAEELDAHARSDRQYLERQEFLQRTELREYELERDKRLASDVRLRGRL